MASGSSVDAAVSSFMSEIREVEKRDSVLTKEQQIKRLTKPGSKYGNLNPYAVLMIGYDVEIDAARKQFRKLSILTHPDKNPENKELAQRAFDAVKAAWETLSDPEKRETCENVIANAKRTLDDEIAAKRKEMRQKGRAVIIPEDDPNVYKQELHKKTVKLFADLERLKHEIANRESEMRKRAADTEKAEEMEVKKAQEFKKNFESTRQKRTDSWNSFMKEKKKKKTKTVGSFKPPKQKVEKR